MFITKLLGKKDIFCDKVPQDLLGNENEIGFQSIWLLETKLWVFFGILTGKNFQIQHTPLLSSHLFFTLSISN